jgi:aminocarboxymuconate-semialdehyde decarboxylase
VFFIHPASDVRFPPEDRYWFRNIIGIPLEETISLAALIFSGVFDKHPDLKVCMAHGGGFACFGLGRFDHAHKVRPECQHLPKRPSDYATNVYFDSLTHSYPKLRYLLDEIGGTKIVLGTDYPADMGQTEPVEWIRGAGNLTTDERHAVLGGNVGALLGDRASAFATS